jgi:hypothetical protein
MENLGKIFGSNSRVKIMRLFLFNDTQSFTLDDIISRSMVKKENVRKEISMLEKIGFLRKKTVSKKITKNGKQKKPKKKSAWFFNKKFELGDALRQLLIESELIKEKETIKRFKNGGNIKLLILSGLFLRDPNRQLDILIVGNKLKKDFLTKEIKKIESEIGKELSYAFFETEEFYYRMNMYDKLIRDVVENENHILINKIKDIL